MSDSSDDMDLYSGLGEDGEDEYIDCPFCGEVEFDKPGLKHHLIRGHCRDFKETAPIKGANE